MCVHDRLPDAPPEAFAATLKRLCIVVVFGIAFGYIEAAVVVYLREIFYPDGFTFPLAVFGIGPLWRRFLLTEIGREAATIVLIFTGAWLFGRDLRRRIAYFLIIFAVWDIFYYVWLKVLLDWPASIMDWDILFLIPVTWASPVLYPVLISISWLAFAVTILYLSSRNIAIKVTSADWLAFFLSGVIMVVSFCIAGLHITEQDFASYFYEPLFAAGYLLGLAAFVRCGLRSRKETRCFKRSGE
ncbi:MAG: hypothetical protein ABIF19_15660 [Planctomycetota bacterium]